MLCVNSKYLNLFFISFGSVIKLVIYGIGSPLSYINWHPILWIEAHRNPLLGNKLFFLKFFSLLSNIFVRYGPYLRIFVYGLFGYQKNQFVFKNEVWSTIQTRSLVWKGLIKYGQFFLEICWKKLTKHLQHESFLLKRWHNSGMTNA